MTIFQYFILTVLNFFSVHHSYTLTASNTWAEVATAMFKNRYEAIIDIRHWTGRGERARASESIKHQMKPYEWIGLEELIHGMQCMLQHLTMRHRIYCTSISNITQQRSECRRKIYQKLNEKLKTIWNSNKWTSTQVIEQFYVIYPCLFSTKNQKIAWAITFDAI